MVNPETDAFLCGWCTRWSCNAFGNSCIFQCFCINWYIGFLGSLRIYHILVSSNNLSVLVTISVDTGSGECPLLRVSLEMLVTGRGSGSSTRHIVVLELIYCACWTQNSTDETSCCSFTDGPLSKMALQSFKANRIISLMLWTSPFNKSQVPPKGSSDYIRPT